MQGETKKKEKKNVCMYVYYVSALYNQAIAVSFHVQYVQYVSYEASCVRRHINLCAHPRTLFLIQCW